MTVVATDATKILTPEEAERERKSRRFSAKSIPFVIVHLFAIVGLYFTGFSWKGLLLALVVYYVRMFGVTGGYHRYFSHRTFKTSRVFHTILAILAMTSSQKGVIWWASHHRVHHKLSDQPGDIHSAKLDGFYWSHMGWILATKYENTEEDKVRDLVKYPELRFVDKVWYLWPTALGVTLFFFGGWHALYWGFFVSTVLLWHGTFTINSLTHMWGRVRYKTTDNSKNSLILALVTMGEGWHNNHHYYQRSVNQGFFWWEIDPTYYVLRALSLVGVVWDLHKPPKHVRDAYLRPEPEEEIAALPLPADAE